MSNVRTLVRWDSTNPEAVLAQVAEGLRYAREQGEIVGIVICTVRGSPDKSGNFYDIAFSDLPAEVVAWAGDAIKRKALG